MALQPLERLNQKIMESDLDVRSWLVCFMFFKDHHVVLT